ncbi:hypothetical protein [Heyndrickxia coagulans]|uniref:Uncharacterized protein n=1 Tax=Heyndrickxia coagulans TaxID=1398 RepID=A0A150K5G4_HEYCO|nr:hypothetical protein [Heyndrickxia coagulans]KYC64722.1 hypothetical protein B4098_3415 [Heyndrickxia coagulans]
MPKYKLVPFVNNAAALTETEKSSLMRNFVEYSDEMSEYRSGFLSGIKVALTILGYEVVEEDTEKTDPAPAATEAEFTTEVGESKFSVSKDEIEVIGKNIQITGLKTPGDIS